MAVRVLAAHKTAYDPGGSSLLHVPGFCSVRTLSQLHSWGPSSRADLAGVVPDKSRPLTSNETDVLMFDSHVTCQRTWYGKGSELLSRYRVDPIVGHSAIEMTYDLLCRQ